MTIRRLWIKTGLIGGLVAASFWGGATVTNHNSGEAMLSSIVAGLFAAALIIIALSEE